MRGVASALLMLPSECQSADTGSAASADRFSTEILLICQRTIGLKRQSDPDKSPEKVVLTTLSLARKTILALLVSRVPSLVSASNCQPTSAWVRAHSLAPRNQGWDRSACGTA